jgi:DNA repair photolyase
VRDMREGKAYDASFASRMRGTGVWADLLRQRFYKAAERLGFRYNRFELDTSRFRPPVRGPGGKDDPQGSLF